uniref:Uncharacterized protein n=1 Tax=Rhizophora mucronata TaxID=61149 RepID=A0A2P2NV59_RHIMU
MSDRLNLHFHFNVRYQFAREIGGPINCRDVLIDSVKL